MTNSWMWPVESGGVNGVNIDISEQHITWFDEAAACACGDNAGVQSFEQFAQNGPILSIPDDVLKELKSSIQDG